MGLIRGTLHIATYGAVSPKSKKQRMAAMQLAAMQGKGQAEIKAAGGRNFDFVNQANLLAKQQREQRRVAQRADLQRPRQETEVRQQIPQSDAVSELERLAALHQSGALDDDEFRVAKARIIGVPVHEPPGTSPDIRTRIAALRETIEAEIGKALERKAQIRAGEEPDLAAVESINNQLIGYTGQLAQLEQLEQLIES